jgi:F-type H+-transporting ATPase subunit a
MAADPSAGNAAHTAWHNPLDDPFHHVVDAAYFDIPFLGEFQLPFGLTKFMVLQAVAFLLALLIFVPLSRKIRNGDPVRGRFWGFWEMLCLYIRDEVVRPTIGDPNTHNADFGGINHHDSGAEPRGQFDPGHDDPLKETLGPIRHVEDKLHTHLPSHELGGHPADKYLPFIWSLFFYVLFCNVLGAIPGLGSPTGSLSVTVPLAIIVFVAVVGIGMKASGAAGFWKSLVPQMDVPALLKPFLIALLWPIELFGLLVKHFVLAVRLYANMMAGHTVLFVILAFISLAANSWLNPANGGGGALGYGMYGAITLASIGGQIFISLLELFVAFLQAYVFAFLATLFVSAAVHPH